MRRSLCLQEEASQGRMTQQAAVSGVDLPRLVTEAEPSIEAEFEPLLGVLPRDYGSFETKVLEDLMRPFCSEHASGSRTTACNTALPAAADAGRLTARSGAARSNPERRELGQRKRVVRIATLSAR
ncbi:MAG: hypothetical protein IT361_05530 [Gemmatimonadaceae bacterium]|nr:hypothetical protein [Gemmatimonadaceae bacterium]